MAINVIKLEAKGELAYGDKSKIEDAVAKEAQKAIENESYREALEKSMDGPEYAEKAESKGGSDEDAFNEALDKNYEDIIDQIFDEVLSCVRDLNEKLKRSLMENVRKEIKAIAEKDGSIEGGTFQEWTGPTSFECQTADIFEQNDVEEIIQKEYEEILDGCIEKSNSEYPVKVDLLDGSKYEMKIETKELLNAIKEAMTIVTEVNIEKI